MKPEIRSSLLLREIPLEEIEEGRQYLVEISGEFFIGSFGHGNLRHCWIGTDTMWDRYSLALLQERGLLRRAWLVEGVARDAT